MLELQVRRLAQSIHDGRHAFSHREGFRFDLVAAEQFGPAEHVAQRRQHVVQIDLGRNLHHLAIAHVRRGHGEIPAFARQVIEVFGRLLEALVFLQAPHQFGTRVVFILIIAGRPRQQHARLDLGQDGGHHQVFGGQFELQFLQQRDVAHVLARDFRDGNIQDVQVLPPDQVQQQVQRALESLQEHFQRIRRNIQVLGDLRDGLALHDGKGHFPLLNGLAGVLGGLVFDGFHAWLEVYHALSLAQHARLVLREVEQGGGFQRAVAGVDEKIDLPVNRVEQVFGIQDFLAHSWQDQR